MAKNDNLKDFLADVANAIREKKGTTDLINPQDFSAEIASIETGGGGAVVSSVVAPKDVNLRDYDGTILYAYTKAQFLALSALPELPSAKGLICEGWNWSLDGAKTYVSNYGKLEMGANYITDDGKTRLYITIAAEGRMDVPLYIGQQRANDVVINWGDGSATETIDGTGTVSTSHTYSHPGSYCITLESLEAKYYLGWQTSSESVLGAVSPTAFCNMLLRVEFGSNLLGLYTYSFNSCYSLETVTMPAYITSVSAYAFKDCYSLKSLVLAGAGVGKQSFLNCSSLASVALGEGYGVTIDNGAFNGCFALAVVTIPPRVTTLSSDVFTKCYSLVTAVIPDSVTQLMQSSFYNCSSLVSMVMPALTKIDQNAFYICKSLAFLDFSKQTSVPTLSNANAFSTIGTDSQIIVPYQLYDAWRAAPNWSTVAANIVRNVTATECISLNITAEDVYCGNLDEANITWTAVVNGVLNDGSRVEGITISGKEKVHIGKNKTAASITKAVTYEYLGVTATVEVTQGAYLDNVVICKYIPGTTTNTTSLVSSSFADFSNYFPTMVVDGGEEVTSATTYKFTTLDEHIVIFKKAEDVVISNLYRMFYNNVAYLIEADLSALDMSAVTSTSTSAGTAYMFYSCSRLKTIKLPASVTYLGYYMFYASTQVTSITIEALTAPKVYGTDTWGYSSSYVGYANRSKGINRLYVPAGATGYTEARFNYLYNTSYCGFTLEEYLDE